MQNADGTVRKKNNANQHKMNWGKSIVLAFVLFGAFIATLVTVCMRQDVSLVTRDYYKEELVYQAHIDRLAHTAMLTEKPTIRVDQRNVITVAYADFNKVQEGVLQLFRPSDPSQDKAFEFGRSAQSLLYFSTAGLDAGMYRARIRWKMEGQEYYVEQIINL
jgi:hypothetical protein